jgi:microcystin degradation protein MlrC
MVEWLGVGDYILTGPMGKGSKSLCGPSAVVDIGNGNKIVVTSYNHQVLDEQGIVAFGLDFGAFDIMVFRSRVHFHAYYDAVPGAVTLEVDAPGMGPADLSVFEYKNIPADVFPVGRHWQ